MRAYLVVGAIGTALGLWWALPLPSVAGRCPAPGEGAGWCEVQKAWLPALVTVEGVMVAALVLAWAVAVGYPRWRRGGFRVHESPWPDGSDPVLAAASWTVRGAPAAQGRRSRR